MELPFATPTILRRRITPSDQGAYLELPFTVPLGVASISVALTVSGAESPLAAIDLGVRDPGRMRGWSGGARASFTIGEESATPGYLAGPLPAGEWAVVLGAYRAPAGGCEASVEITFDEQRVGWLKGDLHVHTVHSDGAYTLWQTVEHAREIGLDFLALTDHNTTSQNVVCPGDESLILIPGMELTTHGGHANLFGAADPLPDWRCRTSEELRQRLDGARSLGARVSVSHPFEDGCEGCAWEWGLDLPDTWIEVWNGPWRPCNQRALLWWRAELAAGRRLVAIGGSDTHGPHPYVRHGMPTNHVYSQARTGRAILDAIGQGHVCLSVYPEGPRIELRCGASMMGDLVPSDATQAVIVVIEGPRADDAVRLLSDRGLEHEQRVGDQRVELTWRPDGHAFLRVEVWRHFSEVNQVLLAAISNPIYFQR